MEDKVSNDGRERHVPDELGQLGEVIGQLANHIDELEIILTRVLGPPDPPETAKSEAKVARSIVPLAIDIRELRYSTLNISRQVESMHRRLEV